MQRAHRTRSAIKHRCMMAGKSAERRHVYVSANHALLRSISRSCVSLAIPDHATGLGKLGEGPEGLGLWEQTVRNPEAGEVVLEVIASGICGTDLHIADDEFPSDPPVTMGHEVTGEVVRLGDGVDASWTGRRVAVEPFAEDRELL